MTIQQADGVWHVVTPESDDIFSTQVQAECFYKLSLRTDSAAEAAQELSNMSAKTETIANLKATTLAMYKNQQQFFSDLALCRGKKWATFGEDGSITFTLTDDEAAALGMTAEVLSLGVTTQMAHLSGISIADTEAIMDFMI